jgi:Cu(I)/Ag(I) efflux system membrane fusion protein
MRRLALLIGAAAAFALGAGAALLYVRAHSAAAHAAAQTEPVARKVLYWYDPMKPQQHFDRPGKSPYMDMQLLPRYAAEGDPGGAADGGDVRVAGTLAQTLGVRKARAEPGTLASPLRVPAAVAFDERLASVVQSRVAGIVAHLHVRAPLSDVRRGDPLLTLIAPDWTAAQEEYLSLRQAPGSGLDDLRAAARRRLLLLGMDEAMIRAIERSGRAQAQVTVVAPRAGVLREIDVREGASVAAGAPLATINGLEDVWVKAAIPEADSGRVEPGASARATVRGFPGESFSGQVEALLADVDATTRTQTARIVMANAARHLAPGMFASVEITPLHAAAAALLIPSEAVIATGRRTVVIIDAGGGHFRVRDIRIGAAAGGRSAVLEGLEPGDAVVLSGQFLIDSEASLRGTVARLEQEGAR